MACRSSALIFGFSKGPRMTPLYTSPKAPSPSCCSTMTSLGEISHSSRIGAMFEKSRSLSPSKLGYGSGGGGFICCGEREKGTGEILNTHNTIQLSAALTTNCSLRLTSTITTTTMAMRRMSKTGVTTPNTIGRISDSVPSGISTVCGVKMRPSL